MISCTCKGITSSYITIINHMVLANYLKGSTNGRCTAKKYVRLFDLILNKGLAKIENVYSNYIAR